MNYNPNLSQHFAHNFVEPNVTRPRRSIGRRISRAFVRYSILLLMGVGATLAWQSYRDETMEVIRTELPLVASIWPVSTARPPLDGQASAAAVVREVVQQLKPMAVDLAIMRRSAEQLATKVEQLVTKQDQMAQNIATLESIEQDVRKLSSSQTVSPRKPPQPTKSTTGYPSRLLLLDKPPQ
jgi:TolA-binding protein